MSKYECEPGEIGGGLWEELATISQSCLYNEKTIIDYKKSIMDAEYSQALIEESFEKGLKDGRLEGKAEGKLEGILEIVKTMFKNGMPIDTISQFSGIPISELNELCFS